MEEVAHSGRRALHDGVLMVPTLAVFLMAVYGLANAIGNLKFGRYFFGQERCFQEECKHPGHPFETRRFLGRIPFLGDLFYCPPCLAFWIGMAFSRWLLSPSALLPQVVTAEDAMVLDGLGACGVTWILHVATEKLSLGTKV